MALVLLLVALVGMAIRLIVSWNLQDVTSPGTARLSMQEEEPEDSALQGDAAKRAAPDPPENGYRRTVVPAPRDTWAPLPPVTMPLAATWPILKARADRGDAPAACRLAVELGRCRHVLRHRTRILQGDDPALSPNARSAMTEADWQSRVAHCAGVDARWLPEQIAYTRQAALAGNLVAIEAYVNASVFLADMHAGTHYYEDYAREAPRLVEAAIQAGSLPAVLALESASDEEAGNTFLSRAIGDSWDPVRACGLDLLFRKILDHPRMQASQSGGDCHLGDQASTADELKRLDEQAQERFETWFRGRKRPFSYGGFGMYGERDDGRHANDLCENDYIGDPMLAPSIEWGQARQQ